MDFFLINPEGGEIHFPVNPENVRVQTAKKLQTINILNKGDVDFPIGEAITKIRFSSFFPAEYDGSYCRYSNIPNPNEEINKLIKYKEEGKPLRLLITKSPINMMVLIKSIPYEIKGGQVGDIYFNLELRKWQEVKVRTFAESPSTRTAVQGANQLRSREDTKPKPKVYIVKPGDTLYGIAKLQLGDGGKWQDIYDNNRKKIGPDPDLIQVGTKLVMPVA